MYKRQALEAGNCPLEAVEELRPVMDAIDKAFPETKMCIRDRFGFKRCYPVCGQTYPRKLDSRILNALSSICQSACRMATDIRLLQHDRQVEEPFEDKQIGSSAMPYKRNPCLLYTSA